jgi:hypothetical protein
VTFNVQQNPGAARTGIVSIAGRAYTVAQNAAPAPVCSPTLSASGTSVGSDGGSGTVGVTLDASCQWSASSSASWLVITSGASGTGSGTVAFNAGANSSGARTATLTIAGATYTVSQAAAPAPGPACSVTLDKTSILVGGPEANWTIVVTAPDSTCTWTASSDSTWLVVRSTLPTAMPVSGSGSARVRATINTGGVRRVGHFIINGVVYTVTQTGS